MAAIPPFSSNSISISSSFKKKEKDPDSSIINGPVSSSSSSCSRSLTPKRKELMICPLTRTPEQQFQFLGFREIRKKLIKLEIENKERAIYDDEIEDLCKLILDKRLENPKDILMLLKLLSEHFFYGIEDVFHGFIKQLKNNIPEIDAYMTIMPDADMFGPVLTPRGIQEILNFYEQHCQFPPGILSCQALSALPDLIREMEENYQENAMRGWAVYADDFEEDKHIVPVFAFCKNGKVHVFIFDSQGHTLDPRCSPILSRSFDKIQWTRSKNVELYSYKEKRQRGPVECSMYSILDLKNLVEMHMGDPQSTIVDFYEQNPQFCSIIDHPKTYGIYGFPFRETLQLIPAMMKPTQSLSQLKRNSSVTLECSPSYSVKRRLFGGDVIQKEQSPNTFHQDIDSYTLYNRDDVLQNAYVAQHRLEYFVYLLTSILDAAEAAHEESFSESATVKRSWSADLE